MGSGTDDILSSLLSMVLFVEYLFWPDAADCIHSFSANLPRWVCFFISQTHTAGQCPAHSGSWGRGPSQSQRRVVPRMMFGRTPQCICRLPVILAMLISQSFLSPGFAVWGPWRSPRVNINKVPLCTLAGEENESFLTSLLGSES